MPTLRKSKRRVAVALTDPSAFEAEIVRGAIAYNDHDHRWQFVGDRNKPFTEFDKIDLAAVDG